MDRRRLGRGRARHLRCAVGVVALAGCALMLVSTAGAANLRAGSARPIQTKSGELAMPMPRMARGLSIERDPDGGSTATFGVAYAVSNTIPAHRVRADRATVTLRVARSLFTTGPQPDRLKLTKTIVDSGLKKRSVTRRYKLGVPKRVVAFLRAKGMWSQKRSRRSSARRLISVGVQQSRDFKRVDGTYDWTQAATFDGSQKPLEVADNPGGAVTITNSTGGSVWEIDASGYPANSQVGPGNSDLGEGLNAQAPASGNYEELASSPGGVDVALTGQAVSCLYQGNDSSNPNGFNTALAPGASVTATIVADDKESDDPNSSSDAVSTSNAALIALKAEAAVFNAAFSIAFGGPITMPVSLALNFLGVGGACNNQPNIMQVGAVTEDGVGTANYNWAIWDGCDGACGGLANVYNEPWEVAYEPNDLMVTNAVQLAPNSDVTYDGQPLWLAQVWTAGCGVGDASDSNVSGCTSQNTIELRWTTDAACPWSSYVDNGGGPYPQWCNEPPVTSPEIPYCGTDNSGCPSYTTGTSSRVQRGSG